MEDNSSKLRQECWDLALHSFGYSYIFTKRAERYGTYINYLTVFGIIVPISVGATALGYGFNSPILKYAIAIAIPLIIIQLLFSVCSVALKWDDELSYAYESSKDHSNLSDEFKKYANRPPELYEDFDTKVNILNTRLKDRGEQDVKHKIKEYELRMGMRYALREFKRECYGCKIVPLSMESTNCPVCGNFNKSLILKIFKL